MTDTFDIERAERDDWEILHKGDAARLLLDGCTDAAGMHVIEQDGYFLRAFPGRIRNIPAAEPPPVEHVHYCGGVLIHTRDGIPVAYTSRGVRVEVVPADNVRQMKRLTEMVWQKKLDIAQQQLAEAKAEIERMRQRVLNSARTREDGMIEQFEAFKAKVLAELTTARNHTVGDYARGRMLTAIALCQPAKPDAAEPVAEFDWDANRPQTLEAKVEGFLLEMDKQLDGEEGSLAEDARYFVNDLRKGLERVRSKPPAPATPSPVEHTVAAGGPRPVPGERMHYCCGVLIHTRDGIPVAYTSRGVRVELVNRLQVLNLLDEREQRVADCVVAQGERDTARRERDEATERAAAYEAAVIKHNEKMDAIPSWPHSPQSLSEGLRWLAEWFDALYPDGSDKTLQNDLRRWADDAEAANQQLAEAKAEHEAKLAAVLNLAADDQHLLEIRNLCQPAKRNALDGEATDG